jgi:hypothetical protein
MEASGVTGVTGVTGFSRNSSSLLLFPSLSPLSLFFLSSQNFLEKPVTPVTPVTPLAFLPVPA